MTTAKRGPKKKVATSRLREIDVLASPTESAKWTRNVILTHSLPKTKFDIHYHNVNGRDLNVQIGGKCPSGWQTARGNEQGDEIKLTMIGTLIF